MSGARVLRARAPSDAKARSKSVSTTPSIQVKKRNSASVPRPAVAKTKAKGQNRRVVEYFGGEPTAPTDAEFAKWTKFGTFRIQDDAGASTSFQQEQYVTILPEHHDANKALPPQHEFWVGKIKEIRANPDKDVWAKVRWFYRGDEIAEEREALGNGTFDASICGLYERFYSDKCDYVESHCFNDVVNVSHLNEFDMDLAPIDHGEFYCRYQYDHKSGALTPWEPPPPPPTPGRRLAHPPPPDSSSSDDGGSNEDNRGRRRRGRATSESSSSTLVARPNPLGPPSGVPPSLLSASGAGKRKSMKRRDSARILASCVCSQPYAPEGEAGDGEGAGEDELGGGGQVKTMRVCPRPSCRRAYHPQCLEKRHWTADAVHFTSLVAEKGKAGTKVGVKREPDTNGADLSADGEEDNDNDESGDEKKEREERVRQLVYAARTADEDEPSEAVLRVARELHASTAHVHPRPSSPLPSPPSKRRRTSLHPAPSLTRSQSKGKGKAKADPTPDPDSPSLLARAAQSIPTPLLALAGQPLVRGGPAFGITGNVQLVTRARRLVCSALARMVHGGATPLTATPTTANRSSSRAGVAGRRAIAVAGTSAQTGEEEAALDDWEESLGLTRTTLKKALELAKTASVGGRMLMCPDCGGPV